MATLMVLKGLVIDADIAALDEQAQAAAGLTRPPRKGAPSMRAARAALATGGHDILQALQAFGASPQMYALFTQPSVIKVPNTSKTASGSAVSVYTNLSSNPVLVRVEAAADESGGTPSWLYAALNKGQAAPTTAPFKNYGTPPVITVLCPPSSSVWIAGTTPGGAAASSAPFNVNVAAVPLNSVLLALSSATLL